MSSNNNPSAKQQYPDERFIFTFSLFFSFFYISFFLSFYLLEITTVPHCTPHNSFGDERRHKQNTQHTQHHTSIHSMHACSRCTQVHVQVVDVRDDDNDDELHKCTLCVCVSLTLSHSMLDSIYLFAALLLAHMWWSCVCCVMYFCFI